MGNAEAETWWGACQVLSGATIPTLGHIRGAVISNDEEVLEGTVVGDSSICHTREETVEGPATGILVDDRAVVYDTALCGGSAGALPPIVVDTHDRSAGSQCGLIEDRRARGLTESPIKLKSDVASCREVGYLEQASLLMATVVGGAKVGGPPSTKLMRNELCLLLWHYCGVTLSRTGAVGAPGNGLVPPVGTHPEGQLGILM